MNDWITMILSVCMMSVSEAMVQMERLKELGENMLKELGENTVEGDG